MTHEQPFSYKPTFTSFSLPLVLTTAEGNKERVLGFRMKRGGFVYVTDLNGEVPAEQVASINPLA